MDQSSSNSNEPLVCRHLYSWWHFSILTNSGWLLIYITVFLHGCGSFTWIKDASSSFPAGGDVEDKLLISSVNFINLILRSSCWK